MSLSIDDVDILDYACPGGGPLNCDFEMDMCGWWNAGNYDLLEDNLDWVRRNARYWHTVLFKGKE